MRIAFPWIPHHEDTNKLPGTTESTCRSLSLFQNSSRVILVSGRWDKGPIITKINHFVRINWVSINIHLKVFRRQDQRWWIISKSIWLNHIAIIYVDVIIVSTIARHKGNKRLKWKWHILLGPREYKTALFLDSLIGSKQMMVDERYGIISAVRYAAFYKFKAYKDEYAKHSRITYRSHDKLFRCNVWRLLRDDLSSWHVIGLILKYLIDNV